VQVPQGSQLVDSGSDPSTRSFSYTPGGKLDTVTDALGRVVACRVGATP
jgi:hypothetical protein